MESRPQGRLFVSKMQPLLLFECAGGAVRFGAPRPPLRGPYLLNGRLPLKRLQPRFLSRMGKKAPLTVERKHSQGGVASEQTPHPSSCPPLAAYRPRPFRCSSFSHTNRFAGFAWEPCPFANPLKTTKKGAAAPFLGFSPGGGLCGIYFRIYKMRCRCVFVKQAW